MNAERVHRHCAAFALAALASARLSAQAPEQPTSSFPAQAEAIWVDVLATDSKGRPVRGLTAADFTLFDEGRPQPIVAFEAREFVRPGRAALRETQPVATNRQVDPTRRSFAFVIDDLGLDPVQSAPQVRKALVEWLTTKADPWDDVTIVSTSGELWWSAPAGTGLADLVAVLARLKGQRLNRELEKMTDVEAVLLAHKGHSGGGLGRGGLQESRGGSAPAAPGPPLISAQLAEERLGLAESIAHRIELRQTTLFGLVTRLAQAFESRGGRKSIVAISDGLVLVPNFAPSDLAIEAALHANAPISFLDARGLPPASEAWPALSPSSSAGFVENRLSDPGRLATEGAFVPIAGADQVTTATGGITVASTNDLGDGFARLNDGSAADYLLGYQPDSAPDGRWHSLVVKTSRPGVTVRARRGYLARPGSGRIDSVVSARGGEIAPSLLAAEAENEIGLRLVARPLGPASALQSRVLVGLDIETEALRFEGGPSGRAAELDVTLVGVSREQPRFVPSEQRVTIQRQGDAESPFAFTRELLLPVGVVQVTALVREVATGRSGSVTQRLEVTSESPSVTATAPLAEGPGTVASGELELVSRPSLSAPRVGSREVVVATELAGRGLELSWRPDDATFGAHLALAITVRDQLGREVQRLTDDWSLEGPEPGAAQDLVLRHRGTLTLPPGSYVLESCALDLESGRLGVSRQFLELRAPGALPP